MSQSAIDLLNLWGAKFLPYAESLLWQSSLLILLLFAFDLTIQKKVQPAMRYAFWLILFIKLILPPSLALPTGPAWWLRSPQPTPPSPRQARLVVINSHPSHRTVPATTAVAKPDVPAARLSIAAILLLSAISGTSALIALVLSRCYRLRLHGGNPTDTLPCLPAASPTFSAAAQLLSATAQQYGFSRVQLLLTEKRVSPAVYGFFRPVIILPRALLDELSPTQLRVVFLHEILHLQRGDVWINCIQTAFQVLFWWNPLLWLANARIRTLREQAVDEAVMDVLGSESEVYPTTLLQVARLMPGRVPLLGLIGILETKRALRHRIERLLAFHSRRRISSFIIAPAVFAFGAMAIPMGEPPTPGQPVSSTALSSQAIIRASGPKGSRLPDAIDTSFFSNPLFPDPNFSDQPKPQWFWFHAGTNGESTRAGLFIPTNSSSFGHPDQFLLRVIKTEAAPPGPEYFYSDFNVADAFSRALAELHNATPSSTNQNYFTRIINFNTNTFFRNVRKHAHLADDASGQDTFLAFRSLLEQAKLDLAPPKSMFFQDRRGQLIVYATLGDIDHLERLVNILQWEGHGDSQAGKPSAVNASTPAKPMSLQTESQITIQTEFMEVSREAFDAFKAEHSPPRSDALLSDAIRKQIGQQVQPTDGICVLPANKSPAVLRSLTDRVDTKVLNEAAVTTLSGRECQIASTDLQTIVMGVNPHALVFEGVKDFYTQSIATGPVLNVVPHLSADGFTIQLAIAAHTFEFLGYDKPGKKMRGYVDGKRQDITPPLPHFRLRNGASPGAIVWDGQTLVIGCQDALNIRYDGLGNATTNSEPADKPLLIFITPTLVDPAGNRINGPKDR